MVDIHVPANAAPSQLKRTESFIHNTPAEIILKIFKLVIPPSRDGLYDLLRLIHVCQSWRTALINQPRMWSTIFATQEDRRDFVEMCLKRSCPFTLDVTVNASERGENHPGCTCDRDMRGRHLPNEGDPCQWHFTFESLATLKHSKRIRTLHIDFHPAEPTSKFQYIWNPGLALGSCRFFALSFPQLTSLRWKDARMEYTNHIFSNSLFITPTVRSLSFERSWGGLFAQVKNLTSFTFVQSNHEDYDIPVDVEILRLLMFNNRSLESLSLDITNFEGNSKGPLSIFSTSSHSASCIAPMFCRKLFVSPPSNVFRYFRPPAKERGRLQRWLLPGMGSHSRSSPITLTSLKLGRT